MAAKMSAAIGSGPWMAMEKENVLQALQQEREEIIYPAQHEMEWLNEHMTEIFSRTEINVTEVFKTPGKLRGKTPRTTRKRNAEGARVPLSDIFYSKSLAPSPARHNKMLKNTPAFTIAPESDQNLAQPPLPRSQADSGYQGSSQDVMDVDCPLPSAVVEPPLSPQMQMQTTKQDTREASSQERRTTEGSFHSAKEEPPAKIAANASKNVETSTVEDRTTAPDQHETEQEQMQGELDSVMKDVAHIDFNDIGSPSDESTPERPLVRQSSLTFAALPAREPLKTSIGARTSRTSHIDTGRASYRDRHTGGHSIVQAHNDEEEDQVTDDENIEILGYDESDNESRKLDYKSSTQRLHDKINMLGKAAPPQPSKSIPSAAAMAASYAAQAEAAGLDMNTAQTKDDDEWIEPPWSHQESTRPVLAKSHATDVRERFTADGHTDDEEEFDVRAPELIAHEERLRTPPTQTSPSPGKQSNGFGHVKSASTVTLVSPGKAMMGPPLSPARTIEVSDPSRQTTTPQGSPKRWHDGPLSASKSKLHSIMKTAKGLFSHSASVSAAAKMETLSPKALQVAAKTIPGLHPNIQTMLEHKPLPASPKEGRRTRSSTEREKAEQKGDKAVKAIQKMEEKIEKAREREKQNMAQHRQAQAPSASPTRVADEHMAEEVSEPSEMAPPSVPQGTSKLSRPTRPIRDIGPKAKPQPVSIRVGTMSQRVPSSLASSTAETLNAEPKRPGLNKKTSAASLQSSTLTATFKTTATSQPAKPRALIAAERKKEQDAREAQRKMQLKKDMERKRAAQQDEARKKEQAQRAEEERKERERLAAEQAKRQAQQQAIENKRFEAAKKAEQQRAERAANEAPARPASRLGAAQPLGRSLVNHQLPTNPAKPPKRQLEEDAGPSRPQAPRFGAASQQADAKRRKTEDEGNVEPLPRPTMSGAPIRQSQLGKKTSIFNHNAYAPALPVSHPAPVQSQMQQFPQPPNVLRAHPNAMAQYAHGAKIPFADQTNPPAHTTKTPTNTYQPQPRTLQLVKSSPQYPQGDAIHLPEIPTDSEDEDSDNEGSNAFPIPDWATPGHLTDQLLRQEGMDGDAVFGPIAPLKMEEIFAKGNKERLKRMRERTSSANWAMSGDGLTLEEVKHDREQRERMRVEGGWRYGS